MRWTWVSMLPAALMLAGCGDYQPAAPPPNMPKPAAQAQPAPTATAAQPTPPQQSGMSAGMTAIGGAVGMAPLETAVQGPMGVAPAGRQPPAQAQTPPSTTLQKADVGVGAKGRGYSQGLITTPVQVFFQARERIVFQNVTHALNLYKAMNGPPKSHQEFMDKVIKENNIRLPELPEGDRYLYDPKTEQLMVEQQAR